MGVLVPCGLLCITHTPQLGHMWVRHHPCPVLPPHQPGLGTSIAGVHPPGGTEARGGRNGASGGVGRGASLLLTGIGNQVHGASAPASSSQTHPLGGPWGEAVKLDKASG
ncbi:unnamed protein product [Caretta caretta]